MKIRNKRTGQVMDVPDSLAPSISAPSAQVSDPSAVKQPDPLYDNTIPIVGSTAGGVIGTLAGGVGGPVGAGGGYAAGEAVRNMLARLFGHEGPISQLPSQDRMGETVGNSITSALLDAAFRGLGKIFKTAKNPVGAIDETITNSLEHNPKMVNMNDIANKLVDETALLREHPTMGGKYADLVSEATARMTSQPTLGQPEISLSQANKLRKLLGQTGYGTDTAGSQARDIDKILNSIFRKEITSNSTAAKIGIPVQRGIYEFSDAMNSLPLGLGKVARLTGKVASIPPKVTMGAGQLATSGGVNGIPNPVSAFLKYKILQNLFNNPQN